MNKLKTVYSSRGGNHLKPNEVNELLEHTVADFNHKNYMTEATFTITGDTAVIVFKNKDNGWSALITQDFKEVSPR